MNLHLIGALAMTPEDRNAAITQLEAEQKEITLSLKFLKQAEYLAQMRGQEAYLVEDEHNYHAFKFHTAFGIPSLTYCPYFPVQKIIHWRHLGDNEKQIKTELENSRLRFNEISDSTINTAIAYFLANIDDAQALADATPHAEIKAQFTSASNPLVIENFIIADKYDHYFAVFNDGELISIHPDERNLGVTSAEIASGFVELLNDGYNIDDAVIAATIRHHGQILTDYRAKNSAAI